ncbi:2,4-dienoyl-CoA reductase, mitochondrial [Folsomia candida]|uniref:2,4-dienoyl-CoA reductase, mitochondrial n=1 Tax=Folsomia candida TaxID=158441 RepID=UPI000B9087EC|nr:2,4-dienoyl-CoA reductase, mitochondrial [Folsomia candida]XP_035710743.1 2,4-dienoyl-CoA reductase, mitochondrial [Folsomia candida]XP_035710744.1 2,4-dienoyl-CoA reductase, mitochondrial [Folsomia candida]
MNSSSIPTRPQSRFFPVMKTPMLPKGAFAGKVALITGGGTGLGKGMALMLSSLGASVAILGRRLNVLETTAKDLSASTGNQVLPFPCDIRDPEAVKGVIDKIEEKFGLPNVIVNNAAGNFVSPSERLSPNAWKTIIDIVLNGSANITLETGKRLIKAKKGASYLSITTTYTFKGSGFVVPSAAAKAGVENMCRSLASEWGRYGIRLNCLAPGPVPTEGAWSRLDPTNSFAEHALDTLPTGRVGEVEEIANLASYMLSDYASWMTGETIVLDGGSLPFAAGEFNQFINIPNEQWDVMEKAIRESNAKQKKK